MSAIVSASNGWAKTALLNKAQRYAQIMGSHPKDSWEFAFWSSLTLEFLARAALSNVSPTLLADPKDWNNIYCALGHTPKATKFTPKSIDISSVFSRLKDVVAGFSPDHESFGILHMSRRNEELHSGETPFDSIKNSAWLPSYYQACDVLLASMNENLDFLLGKSEAVTAIELVTAANDASAKAIAKSVNAYKVIWESKTEPEKANLGIKASAWATRQEGHRVKCPACNNDALVVGTASAAPIKSIKNDEITEKQEFIPTKFECVACGLKVSGLSHLSACGLGDAYTATFIYDAAEYYAPTDPFEGYEPDFNEP